MRTAGTRSFGAGRSPFLSAMSFRALLLYPPADAPDARVESVETDRLPEGDVLVRVSHSSLNYKDGLAVTGKGKIIRGEFPFVTGIDLVGTVESSEHSEFEPGNAVVLTGWGTGEARWGGYAERARVSSDHLVRLPDGLSPEHAMVAGTAGFTSMLAVMALEDYGVTPDRGEVAVTGASGGAGSFAVAILAHYGYEVVASTGSEAAHEDLKALGASRIISRDELGDGARRPLDSAKWAGAVDAVGGPSLEALLSQTATHGAVAAFGNAQSHELHTTVFPFILRGVALLGIDSNTCPMDRRRVAWDRLATLPTEVYDRIHSETVGLGEIAEAAERITRGRTRGRVLVDVSR